MGGSLEIDLLALLATRGLNCCLEPWLSLIIFQQCLEAEAGVVALLNVLEEVFQLCSGAKKLLCCLCGKQQRTNSRPAKRDQSVFLLDGKMILVSKH